MLPPLHSTAGVWGHFYHASCGAASAPGFQSSRSFSHKMLGYIYLSHHQRGPLKFLTRKHLSCAVNELRELSPPKSLTSSLVKGGELVTNPLILI